MDFATLGMWKIHRHYVKELAAGSVLTFVVLFGIALVALASRGISRGQSGNLATAVLVTFFWAADTIPHLLSISMLIATVLTFARAGQDREIAALCAAGISIRVPMVAALLVGLVFSIAGSLALHYVIPWVHYQKFHVVGAAIRDFLLSSRGACGQLQLGGVALSAVHQDGRGHLRDVVIRLAGRRSPSSTPASGRVYTAREAWFELAPDAETVSLVLEDLRDASTFRASGQLRFAVSVASLTEGAVRREGDNDLTTDQLLAEVGRGVHHNEAGARFTVHRRSCFAVMPVLFAPIGCCLGVIARDGGRAVGLLLALVPLVMFYASNLVSPVLARAVDWPAMAWLPAAAVALLEVPLCWTRLRT